MFARAEHAAGLLARPQPSGLLLGAWTAEGLWTAAGLLEQSHRLYLERAKRIWNCPQGSCGLCIVRWQDGIAPYIISVLIPSASGTASGLGPPAGLLEQSLGSTWNARSAFGTAAPRPLYCLLVGDIISVLLSAAPTSWNRLQPLGTPQATRTREAPLYRPRGSPRLHVYVCAVIMR